MEVTYLMTNYNLDEISKITTTFRKAILSFKNGELGFIFDRFPAGCCGNTSLMLGAYLYHYYNIDCEYVCGVHKTQSHAWLEVDNIIIDITSDQFKSGVPVFVGKKNKFYKKFREDFRHSWNASLDGQSIENDRLYPQYQKIVDRITKLNIDFEQI